MAVLINILYQNMGLAIFTCDTNPKMKGREWFTCMIIFLVAGSCHFQSKFLKTFVFHAEIKIIYLAYLSNMVK